MTIWGILFTILKTIGIILLILLLLILLILLLVLFVPIRYRIRADKKGWDMNAGAEVTWLLHMLAVDVAFSLRENGDRRFTKDIRLFGISIFKVRDWIAKRRRKKPREGMPDDYEDEFEFGIPIEKADISLEEAFKNADDTLDTVTDKSSDGTSDTLPTESASVEDASDKEAETTPDVVPAGESGAEDSSSPQDKAAMTAGRKYGGSPHKSLIDSLLGIIRRASGAVLAVPGRIMALAISIFMKLIRFFVILCSSPGQIVALLGSAIDKALTIWYKIKVISDFFFDDRTQDAIHHIFAELGHLIGHARPRKLYGYLDFGFTDPSITGRVLGGLSLFLPQCGKTFDINPDFENALFDCDIKSGGRIILFYPILIAVRTILNKNIKYVYRYIKHVRKELSQA